MSVLITGGYGFLGSKIALHLKDQNYKITIKDKKIDKIQDELKEKLKLPFGT